MPAPIAALARQYQNNALRISTIDTRESHSDITYNAIAVSPSDIEHAVVNLLRFHEAETAMLFCATRDNVRHLHATLVERGFSAVALSGEHSQNERNHALQALRDGRARVCVATDVAARGIDVATLSLVIHVELPRDAETLQHRSGRTGRAGRKGTAVLVVPYPRRRRMEMLLRSARIAVEWVPVPSAEAIRANDHDRLLKTLLEPVEVTEEDNTLAEALLAQRTPLEIAAALVRSHRARLPQPEEMIESSPAERAPRREVSTTSCGSAWTLAAVRTPIRAGCCRCCAAVVTSRAVKSVRSASARTKPTSRCLAMWKPASATPWPRPPVKAPRTSGIRIEPSPEAPREVARRNTRGGNDGAPRPHRKGPREGGHGGGYQGKPKGPRY
jgi:ATP-dependent RNA helicase DeaD